MMIRAAVPAPKDRGVSPNTDHSHSGGTSDKAGSGTAKAPGWNSVPTAFHRHLSNRFSSAVMPTVMPTPMAASMKMMPNTPLVLKLAP
jgi:hypothetical protein